MLPLYDNIRRRRIELGISQQELANMLGYTSRTTIAKIEAGAIDIPQSKIVAFAEALNTSPGILMGWTEPENKALWRYTDIENDKIVHRFPGLVDSKYAEIALIRELNSPLKVKITDDVLSQNERRLLFIYRNNNEFKQEIDKIIAQTFDNSDSDDSAPTRTIKVAAYGGGITEHNITATDEQIQDALAEGEMDPFPLKPNK